MTKCAFVVVIRKILLYMYIHTHTYIHAGHDQRQVLGSFGFLFFRTIVQMLWGALRGPSASAPRFIASAQRDFWAPVYSEIFLSVVFCLKVTHYDESARFFFEFEVSLLD